MEIVLLPQAQKDRDYWKKSGNKAIMERISALLKDIMEHPYTGIGKPEPLKYDLAGKWSRRINAEHRLIYSVNENIITVYVFSMRYHNSKK
jgi:toxin YoeB